MTIELVKVVFIVDILQLVRSSLHILFIFHFCLMGIMQLTKFLPHKLLLLHAFSIGPRLMLVVVYFIIYSGLRLLKISKLFSIFILLLILLTEPTLQFQILCLWINYSHINICLTSYGWW